MLSTSISNDSLKPGPERNFVHGVSRAAHTDHRDFQPCQRLQGQALPPSELRSAALISTEAKRMADLFRVLRDRARSDSGRLQLHCQRLDSEEQLLLVYESQSTFAGARLLLHQLSPAALPALWADPVCVHECLQELIRNAL